MTDEITVDNVFGRSDVIIGTHGFTAINWKRDRNWIGYVYISDLETGNQPYGYVTKKQVKGLMVNLQAMLDQHEVLCRQDPSAPGCQVEG